MAIAQRFSNRAVAEVERQNMGGDAQEAYFIGIENSAVVNLILVRIVGGDSSKWMHGKFTIPLREDGGPVIGSGAEDLIGIFLFPFHQFRPFGGVLHRGAEVIVEFLFILGVGLPVVNFHAIEARTFVVSTFFNAPNTSELFPWLWKPQKVIFFS